MDKSMIESLREALKVSPDNLPLRLHLAETLLTYGQLEEARIEFQEALRLEANPTTKMGMARVFYEMGEYAQCNVILEELIESGNEELAILLLHTRALLKEDQLARAIEVYQKILEENPGFSDEELDSHLRLTGQTIESPIEADDAFLEKPELKFEDVGGMDDVKKEIDLKIIQPLKHPEIYKAYGKKVGGGILLYGPPGCGKTYLAKATAGQVNAKFISVGLNDILDMWIGNSEKNLHEIFEVARRNTPCVLFFDEIDALGASRKDMKNSGNRMLINQFLQELDGVDSDNDGVLIIGATNAPWQLDNAFRRPGRFDRMIFVPPPDESARKSIFNIKLKDKPTDSVDHESLAKKTHNYSGADIEAVLDIAIEGILEEAIKIGAPRPMTTKDILRAIKKHKASTLEWFTSAKNYALYANESGIYDEVLDYLKVKK